MQSIMCQGGIEIFNKMGFSGIPSSMKTQFQKPMLTLSNGIYHASYTLFYFSASVSSSCSSFRASFVLHLVKIQSLYWKYKFL